MAHRHHIVPRHMGGSDDPSNLIELSVEDHALAHKLLWETYGREEDRIAWLALSGQITSDEARRAATALIWKGKHLSEEHRTKISRALTGRIRPEWEKEKIRGFKHTSEAIEKIRIAGTGRTHKESVRKAIATARSKAVNTPWGLFTSAKDAAKYMSKETGKSVEACRWHVRNNIRKQLPEWSNI